MIDFKDNFEQYLKHLDLVQKNEPEKYEFIKEVAGSSKDIDLSKLVENTALLFEKYKKKYSEITSNAGKEVFLKEQIELYTYANFRFERFGDYANQMFDKYQPVFIEALEYWKKEFGNLKALPPQPINVNERPKPELKLNEFFIKEVSSDTIEAIQTEFRELEGKDLAILIYLLHKEHKIIEILTNSRTKGRKGFVKCLKETDNPTMQKVNKCFTPNTDDLIYSKDDLVFQSLNKRLTKTIKI